MHLDFYSYILDLVVDGGRVRASNTIGNCIRSTGSAMSTVASIIRASSIHISSSIDSTSGACISSASTGLRGLQYITNVIKIRLKL